MNRVSFNHDAFISVFADFYAVTGVNISIFEPPVKVSVYDKTLNYANCVTYPTSYPPGLCGHIRLNKRVDAQCLRSDENAVNQVMTNGRTLIYECPFGFREALIPAVCDGEVAAIIFIGQLNGRKNADGFNYFYSLLSHTDPEFADRKNEELQQLYFNMVTVDDGALHSMCRLIELFIELAFEREYITLIKNNLHHDFIQYVTRNISKKITLDDVCRELNVSKPHLCRIVKKEFGVSFTQYINFIKMNKAKLLLKNGNHHINEIASLLGYDNTNYFSRLFKIETGTSPIEYRRYDNIVL